MRPGTEFIAVPKTASRTVIEFCELNGLAYHDHTHDLGGWTRSAPGRLACEEIFVVVRDPIDRFLSAYSYLKAGGNCELDRRIARLLGSALESANSMAIDHLAAESVKRVHFLPQWFWVDALDADTDLSKFVFLRYENLEEDLRKFAEERDLLVGELPHLNASKRTTERLTVAATTAIREIYTRDYELINDHT